MHFPNYDSAEKLKECFDKLSMNGFDFNNFNSFPFVLSLSKDSEKEFSAESEFSYHSLKQLCYSV